MGRDAGSHQAGQHNADHLQRRQPQGSSGNRKHVAADEGRDLAEAAITVQPVDVGWAQPAAPPAPAATEGHRAILLECPGRREPVAVALHATASQGTLQGIQGVRLCLVLAIGVQGLAQPFLETPRHVLAVEEPREPCNQPGHQHGTQEGAVGAQEPPVLRGSAEAAQEAPDDDGSACGQEDGGGVGVVAGRQRQEAAQPHLGPEADDEHGEPGRPEDEAEGHEEQLERCHGACGGC